MDGRFFPKGCVYQVSDLPPVNHVIAERSMRPNEVVRGDSRHAE
jgi:hypothetical protein